VSDERAHELTEAFIAGRVGAACISDPEEVVASRQAHQVPDSSGNGAVGPTASALDPARVGSES
ncbi:MAG: hypothetical protein WB801_00695, partial [Candidatus Dormiibacterota bacterium]